MAYQGQNQRIADNIVNTYNDTTQRLGQAIGSSVFNAKNTLLGGFIGQSQKRPGSNLSLGQPSVTPANSNPSPGYRVKPIPQQTVPVQNNPITQQPPFETPNPYRQAVPDAIPARLGVNPDNPDQAGVQFTNPDGTGQGFIDFGDPVTNRRMAHRIGKLNPKTLPTFNTQNYLDGIDGQTAGKIMQAKDKGNIKTGQAQNLLGQVAGEQQLRQAEQGFKQQQQAANQLQQQRLGLANQGKNQQLLGSLAATGSEEATKALGNRLKADQPKPSKAAFDDAFLTANLPPEATPQQQQFIRTKVTDNIWKDINEKIASASSQGKGAVDQVLNDLEVDSGIPRSIWESLIYPKGV